MRRAPLSPDEVILYIAFRCAIDESDPDSCWRWLGCRSRAGQRWPGRPICKVPGTRSARTVQRIVWETSHGPIEDKQVVRMNCRDSFCCNPKHMQLTTRRQAMREAAREGRISRGRLHAIAMTKSVRAHAHVKLNEDIVLRMRERYAEIGNAAQIAREFNINHAHAHRICTNQAWRVVSPWQV